ncbi:atrial natriuretic peptide receptor 1-like [Paramacrobiotus metropolitanus]|uniref:atrial natriuretic peptide receptor 1-like n=1 Tax=Paramacrobiotus metropolitanus TaxID=2943436 RepID=UPI002445D6AB|nr:atrial natriuretic peptide receptor 1-like [Paramacrobiotus metropolitanus]
MQRYIAIFVVLQIAGMRCKRLTTLHPDITEFRTLTTTFATTNRTTTHSVPNTTTMTAAPTPTTTFPTRVTPPPGPGQKEVRLCIAMENNPALFYDYLRVAAAIDMGLEYANKNIMQDGFVIKKEVMDIGGKCLRKNEVVTHAALKLFLKNVTCHAYLGPGCGYNADILYNFVEYTQTPIIALPAAGSALSAERNQYPLLIRSSFAHKNTINFLFRFLDDNDYRHVMVIMDTSNSFYEQMSVTFSAALRKRKDRSAGFNTVNYRSDAADNDTIDAVLRNANSSARVFIVLAGATAFRAFMIAADQAGMTDGNYVYIGVELFQSDTWGAFTWSMGTAQDREAKSAYGSVLLVALRSPRLAYYDDFAAQVKKRSRKDYGYTFGGFEEIDPVTISAYESVRMYADVIREVQDNQDDIFDGSNIASAFQNRTFTSPLSGEVGIDAQGDRLNDFVMRTFDKNGRLAEFYLYRALEDKLEQTGPPIWGTPDGLLPPDEPRCGYTGDNPACQPAKTLSGGLLAAAVVVPLLVCIGLAACLAVFVVRMLRSQSDPNWWKVQHSDLEVTGANINKGSQGSAIGSKKSFGDDAGSVARSEGTSAGFSVMIGRTATLNGNLISVHDVSDKRKRPNATIIKEMNQVRTTTHQNLQRLLGASINDEGLIVFILGELCQKGSLTDLLEKDSLKLDWSFKNSLIKDIVMGMTYLHNSSIESHGNLTAHTCLVDSRFMLKISDYGLPSFRDLNDLNPPTLDQDEEHRNFGNLLWRAPEFLRQPMPVKGSPKADVYSFGILLQQIILRCSPFDVPTETRAMTSYQSAKDLVLLVKQGTQPPFRPKVPASACSSELYNLMERCWEEYPIERPTFAKIKDGLKKVIGNSGDNIIDHLLKRMEQYASDLEQQVEEKTAQFMEEKRRSEELLGQLLPRSVAESLTRGQNVDPELFDCVSIYFSDIVGFTTISAAGTPMDVVSMLNNLYTMFDGILEKFSAYKVETIGDAYMVASGLPVRNGNRHAYEIAMISLTIRKELNNFRIPHQPDDKLKLRIGMHCGPCVAGIVGLKMPRYCLFGDTVAVAQKMESSGEALKIQITFAAKELLDDIGGFQMMERDHHVEFQGREIRTFWLLSGK